MLITLVKVVKQSSIAHACAEFITHAQCRTGEEDLIATTQSLLQTCTTKLKMLHLAAISFTLLYGLQLSFGQTTGGGVRPEIKPDYSGVCEEINISYSYCANIRRENTVYLPNWRGHDTQLKAFEELDDYFPLINSSCSNGLYHFLCSYYFPLCYRDPVTDRPTKLKPCRSLCEYVRPPCEAVLLANNHSWPTFFNCSLGDFSDGETCFGPPDPNTAIFTTVGHGPVSRDTSPAVALYAVVCGVALALLNIMSYVTLH